MFACVMCHVFLCYVCCVVLCGVEQWGLTSTIYAVNNGHYDCVKHLVDNGADINIADVVSKLCVVVCFVRS